MSMRFIGLLLTSLVMASSALADGRTITRIFWQDDSTASLFLRRPQEIGEQLVDRKGRGEWVPKAGCGTAIPCSDAVR